MDNEIIIYLVIGVVIGFIIGLIFMNVMSPKARQYAKVKRELDQTKDELNAQKQVIVKHFSHSAEILDSMAKDFRRLYQHMAENSGQLINPEETPIIDINSGSEPNIKRELSHEEQPRDYSGNPSGLLKTEEHKS